MIEALSRALMRLAASCLGEGRREWALAMQAEFEAVREGGSGLKFASGCLIAACRELPNHSEGQLSVASHVTALGLLVPLASLQFLCGLETSMVLGRLSGLGSEWSHNPFLASAQNAGMPALHVLWLLLGAWQLHLAWLLLERDWERVAKAGALIGAAMLTLLTFMAVLMLGVGPLMVLGAVLAGEAIFITALARWHARIFQQEGSAKVAW